MVIIRFGGDSYFIYGGEANYWLDYDNYTNEKILRLKRTIISFSQVSSFLREHRKKSFTNLSYLLK